MSLGPDRVIVGLIALCLTPLAAQLAGQPPTAADEVEVIRGERIDPVHFGPGVIESMQVAMERDRLARAAAPPEDPGAPKRGAWEIPAPRAAERPASGTRYAVNAYGATEMAVTFPTLVSVDGAFLAGQGSPELWAECLRVVGYRGDERVDETEWFAVAGSEPAWYAFGLVAVDRIVIEAAPRLGGAAWYGIDDLTFTPVDESGAPVAETVTLDFEDANFKQKLTGSGYAGLVWEEGSLGYRPQELIVPAPRGSELGDRRPQTGEADTGEQTPRGTATPPTLSTNFRGVIRGDAGSFSAPPDTCGAAGPDHFVITVNRNFAVYDKSTGAELINILLGSFLPGSNGDPRVLYDQHSGRWIVIVTDFSAGARIYLAVSTTSDATGTWFKTNFVTDQGSDAGRWPDYPTLGVDANGIYTAAYMVGGAASMTIFAIDKAPLIAPSPSLGTVTAFRGLPFEGAIQPVHTYGSPPGQYFISTGSSSSLRVRRVNPPLTSPTLTTVGNVGVTGFNEPPDAPAQGSSTPLDTVGSRLMNAVYRDGSIYTAHCIAFGGRAACRWYQVSTSPLALVQSGTVSSSTLYYFFPGIAVNSRGDLVMGFSGSNAGQFAAAYYTGRLAGDPPGLMATPALLKAGQASHNILDGAGRNRFGDYSLSTLDPDDELTLWTIQEYVEATDIWGTWVARLESEQPPLVIALPGGAPTVVSPGVAAMFEVQITPGAQNVVPGSQLLHYRFSGGSYQTAPLVSQGGDLYQATLPAAACGDLPEFYVSAAGDGGAFVTSPADAPASVYSATVGELTVAFADDFQTDQGWTVENVSLADGPWERAIPSQGGGRGDPAGDFDGSGFCYVTDNGASGDVDGGPTRLISPVFDLSAAGEYRVSYARWFSNDDNDIDRLDVHVSSDGGSSWVLAESVGGTTGWVASGFDVGDFVTPTAQVRVRFSATDNPNDSVTEAAVDAFQISRLTCEQTPCPGDLNGDDQVGFEDLVILLGAYGVGAGGDLNGDGQTNFDDLIILLAEYGTSC